MQIWDSKSGKGGLRNTIIDAHGSKSRGGGSLEFYQNPLEEGSFHFGQNYQGVSLSLGFIAYFIFKFFEYLPGGIALPPSPPAWIDEYNS